MIVLEGRDLAKRYSRPSAAVEALRGVSFHLEAGEILGIAGESGSGTPGSSSEMPQRAKSRR